MNALKPITFSAETLDSLRRDLETRDEILPFQADFVLAERIAAIGIAREVGTMNDELARFIFDADQGVAVEVSSLKPEFVEWQENIGVRIRSTQTQRLELRARGFTELTHPSFSYNDDGTIHSLLIFPKLIAKIAAIQGVELVVVKSWAMNSIFGGFDPAKGYYQTNFWELENNDSLLFSELIRHGRLALLGTHDLIAHVSGVRKEKWVLLRQQAQRVHDAISTYFQRTEKPTIASLILPYTIGVVLDDLAQPPTYGSPHHELMLNALIEALHTNSVPPDTSVLLTRFPASFEKVIQLARDPRSPESPNTVKQQIAEMISEIQGAMIRTG